MIIVANRELLIPREEFNIGTNYDNNSEIRLFKIDRITASGVDISNLQYSLDIVYANKGIDMVSLDKETTCDSIFLTWTIENSMLQVPGTVLVQIRAFDVSGAVKWSSYVGAFFAEDAINVPGKYTGDLSELEKIEISEAARVQAENERKQAEEARQTAEQNRQSAEAERVNAENGRVNAESQRVLAEQKREAAFEQKSSDSEAYAIGTRGGEPVQEGDPAYKNNSKYYSELAGSSASSAAQSEENASQSEESAEASALSAAQSKASANTDANRAEIAAANAEKYSQIVAPAFWFDIDEAKLYMKSGVGMDFYFDEDAGKLYWRITP